MGKAEAVPLGLQAVWQSDGTACGARRDDRDDHRQAKRRRLDGFNQWTLNGRGVFDGHHDADVHACIRARVIG